MSLLPKSIHRCRRYPTKFNSGRDIPVVIHATCSFRHTRRAFELLCLWACHSPAPEIWSPVSKWYAWQDLNLRPMD